MSLILSFMKFVEIALQLHSRVSLQFVSLCNLLLVPMHRSKLTVTCGVSLTNRQRAPPLALVIQGLVLAAA
jgi:hypothetical protein